MVAVVVGQLPLDPEHASVEIDVSPGERGSISSRKRTSSSLASPIAAGSASHSARVEESDPAHEGLGSGKCNHRKRRPLKGDQRVDPERDPPEDE
jgi:hypothetical protein